MNGNLSNRNVAQAATNVVSMPGVSADPVRNARVCGVNGRSVSLELNQGGQTLVEGRIAFSCLVTPRENDAVVCVQDETGDFIVLAILDRPDEGPASQDMTLTFPANASLVTTDGDLKMVARDDISIVSGESLICSSNKAVHQARNAAINYRDISAQGESISARYASMQVLCDLVSSVIKRALQKFDHYVRHSAENDQVSARYMERKIEGLYSMNSGTTMMISKKDTKIDAERIHMG